MKIIILGAGQVGATLAEHLVGENNDITIIDINFDKLANLQERLDIRTIPGRGSYPNILRRAGIEEADMLVAVTSEDETNMVACQVAYTLYQTPIKIARVRALQYLAHEELFGNTSLPVDVLISPEQLVTNHIHRLIEHPDAFQVFDFTNPNIQLVAVKAEREGQLVNKPLKYLHADLPQVDCRIVAIFRQGNPIPPEGNTVIKAGDEVFIIARKQNFRDIIQELRVLDPPNKNIIIAGGGNIGTRLAMSLEHNFNVKIIEHNPEKTSLLAHQLSHTLVLEGEAADKTLLLNENIEHTDVFCAVTNHDEANIMSAILAKRLGAKIVMALINKPAYAEITSNSEIDVVISPQQTTIGSLLTHVRRGDIVNVHSLRQGAAEAIEAIAHGTHETSNVIGRKIVDIALPKGATIGALIRGDRVMMAHHDVIIEDKDHVIVFLIDKSKIADIERLFQPPEN